MWTSHIAAILFLVITRGCQGTHDSANDRESRYYPQPCTSFDYPLDCADIASKEKLPDGVYLIYPRGEYSDPVPVYCDMTSAGGPWTVFQKRFDGSVSFYRSWLTYRHGFGTANGEYWLGLENIHLLTMKKSYRLKIVLKDWQNKVGFVTYDKFSISRLAINANKNGYQLSIGAFKEGDRSNPLGDSLTYHNGMKFTTYDRDLDQYNSNCAMKYYGAFWYKDCHGANLNGEYLQGNTTQYGMGIVWGSGKGYYYSYKGTMMMIGPSA